MNELLNFENSRKVRLGAQRKLVNEWIDALEHGKGENAWYLRERDRQCLLSVLRFFILNKHLH